jgi:hypothetical protein
MTIFSDEIFVHPGWQILFLQRKSVAYAALFYFAAEAIG